jgi:hypothetical protein
MLYRFPERTNNQGESPLALPILLSLTAIGIVCIAFAPRYRRN